MHTAPRISIITPVYNSSKFIESCIKSVIAQNCSDAEHIIMDGESTDGTVEIIKSYADNYSHIRWVSEKDKGQSDAMNKGISIAKGEILGILNADDFYEPNTLNRVIEIFRQLPEPSLVVGNCKVLDDNDQIKHINKPNNLNLKDLLLNKVPHPYNPSAYFYHKSLHSRIGPYDINEHYVMDLDFLFKAIRVANVTYIDEIFGNYRSIEGTKTNTTRQQGQLHHLAKYIRRKHIEQLPFSEKLQILVEKEFISVSRKIKRLPSKLKI